MTTSSAFELDQLTRLRFEAERETSADRARGTDGTVSQWILILLCPVFLSACEPSEQRESVLREKKRIECLDKFCEGDAEPKLNATRDVALKINGQWFIGPREYFSQSNSGASIEWWNHRPLPPGVKRLTEAQALASSGKGYDLSIDIFFRSNHLPPEPYGYRLIELAEAHGWIADRSTLRQGLDEIKMKHVLGPHGSYIDHVAYYVATDLRGPDGLPPVATCNHDHPDHGGGTGFLWMPEIWAGVRMNQRHCADWPEIYSEISRVLDLLKKANQ